MLVLPIVGNCIKYGFSVVPNGITSITNFIQIRPAVLELNHADRQTDVISPICVHFIHIVQRTPGNELELLWWEATVS
jgi:hypothetical protein